MRNNILVNTRNESPYCASSIRGSAGFYSLTSNYNALYCEPNQNNYLVRFNYDYLTILADWQAAGKDANSITELAHFTAPDLHLDWFYSTLLDGYATPIVGITTDIDGEPRNALTPDIGADEGVVVPVELTSFMALANGEEVTLSWSTATELNNEGFEVQRKALQVMIL